jgi:hypothetical protein
MPNESMPVEIEVVVGKTEEPISAHHLEVFLRNLRLAYQAARDCSPKDDWATFEYIVSKRFNSTDVGLSGDEGIFLTRISKSSNLRFWPKAMLEPLLATLLLFGGTIDYKEGGRTIEVTIPGIIPIVEQQFLGQQSPHPEVKSEQLKDVIEKSKPH